jgi:hypothetical protein
MWTSLHEESVLVTLGAGAAAVGCAGDEAAEEEAGAAVGAFACQLNTCPSYDAVIHWPPLLLDAAEGAGITAGGVDCAGTFQLFSQETTAPSIVAVTQSARFSRGAGAA